MKCNCSISNIILGVIILIFALWQNVASMWVIVIASILLIIHELWHKHSHMSKGGMKEDVPAKRKRR